MKYLILMASLFTYPNAHVIFDFTEESTLENWMIVDDVVMGGRSSGNLTVNTEGHGVFSGRISLENYGGFSSVRYNFDRKSIGKCTKVVLKIKGDGKNYQFRVKTNADDYYSYVAKFETSGDWEEIQIPLASMYPSFRGRTLNMLNFSAEYMEEIALLIGNKTEEKFELLIDSITLK